MSLLLSGQVTVLLPASPSGEGATRCEWPSPSPAPATPVGVGRRRRNSNVHALVCGCGLTGPNMLLSLLLDEFSPSTQMCPLGMV